MMRYFVEVLYDTIYGIGLFLSLPVFGRRLFGRDKRYHDFLERCGIYDKEVLTKLRKSNIWIHTVSIGELLASLPLIQRISQEFKDRQIVVSCVSRAGRFVAHQKLSDNIIKIFLPFDFSLTVRNAITTIKPEIFISVETEIWPNLFINLKRYKSSILILNGRISESSFKKYSFFKFILRHILNTVDCFIMRSEKDASRIEKLGVSNKKIVVSRSTKFDQAYQLSKIAAEQFNSKIIVFGSIHRGEEEPVVEIIKKLLTGYRDISFVIVPRALDRTNIYQILRQKNIQYEKLSSSTGKARVLIVDKYGLLTEFYRRCDIAFVGGSLVPAGGQNPIEPLAFKKVVIYGKFHWDFEQEWKKIIDAGGGLEVGSFEELYKTMEFLLNNPTTCRKMGEAGFRVILENMGATDEIIKIIGQYLKLQA